MVLPNFIIFGVEKAGTTSIYNYLKQHPQIYMSPIKETNFFEKDWENALPEVKAKKRNGIYSLEKYCQLFEAVTDEIAIGEVSPNYLFHYQESVKTIKAVLPDAKMIAILRNPVDRAYSDYLMHIRDVIGQPQTLKEQLKHRPQQSFTLRKGLYYEPLKHYFDAFSKENIKIYLYDDLCQDAVELMQDIYSFLNVDSMFKPDTSYKSQVAQVPKNKNFNYLLRVKNPFRTSVASFLKMFLSEKKRQMLRSQLLSLNSTKKASLTLSSDERSLLLEYYREDILKLQGLINRDLSAWLV